MEGKRYLNLYIKLFLVIIFSVGTAGHFVKEYRELMLDLTPLVLFITSGVVIYSLIREKKNNIIYWCGAAYIITFFAEVIGVSTGILFGSYTYGDTLGLKLFGVPVIIGVNWVLIIAGASGIAKKFIRHSAARALAAGLIAVIFDYILEPVAVKFGYWHWENNLIPLSNYISWFIIAYIVTRLQDNMDAFIDNDVPQVYLLIQAVFFLLLNFA